MEFSREAKQNARGGQKKGPARIARNHGAARKLIKKVADEPVSRILSSAQLAKANRAPRRSFL